MSKFKKFLIIILTGLIAISGVVFGSTGIGLGEVYISFKLSEMESFNKVFSDNDNLIMIGCFVKGDPVITISFRDGVPYRG